MTKYVIFEHFTLTKHCKGFLKTHPPTKNLKIKFCMAVWIWQLPKRCWLAYWWYGYAFFFRYKSHIRLCWCNLKIIYACLFLLPGEQLNKTHKINQHLKSVDVPKVRRIFIGKHSCYMWTIFGDSSKKIGKEKRLLITDCYLQPWTNHCCEQFYSKCQLQLLKVVI